MNGSLLAAALLLQLPTAEATRLDDLFLPVFACQSQPLDEWLRRFDGSGGSSSKALWCIFYRDDGSERVRNTLRQWYRNGSDETVRKEILAILTHWGVAVDEPVQPEEAPVLWRDRADYPLSTRPFTPPFAPLDGDLAMLHGALGGEDRVARARAALALIRGPQDVDLVVQTLVRARFAETKGTWRGRLLQADGPSLDIAEITGHALEWCIEFAGDAADAALVALVQDPTTSDDVRRFVLRQVPFSRHQDARLLGTALLPLMSRDDEIGRRALQRLVQAHRGDASAFEPRFKPTNWDIFVEWRQERIADPDVEDLLANALAARLQIELRQDTLSTEFVDDALWLATRSEHVRARIVPLLVPLLAREDALGDDILYALASLGEHGAAVRRRYVKALDAMEDLDHEGLGRIPCLVKHDDRTLAALERLYHRIEARTPLAYPLFVGGLLRPDGPALGREFLAWCEEHGGSVWSPLYALGLRGEPMVQETDLPMVRMMKHAIAIRTRQEQGRDATTAPIEALLAELRDGKPVGNDGTWANTLSAGFSVVGKLGIASPEFLNWSLAFMLDALHYHQSEVAEMLTHYSLDRRQQAVLCQVEYFFGIEGHVEVLARQGECSLERVAKIRELLSHSYGDYRTRAQRIDLDVLAAVLRITRLTIQEQAWLAAALEGGLCTDRVRALELIHTHRLDTPALRAAVDHAAINVDSRVRFAAAQVREGWGQ